MANATQTVAPEKKWALEEKFSTQEYDPEKRYVFQLVEESPERTLPIQIQIPGTQRYVISDQKKFKPSQNIVFSSQIIWKGERRGIRYYDGCKSLFVDEQPQNKDIVDTLIRQSAKRFFIDGFFGCMGYDKQLLLYMQICSWNVDSPFRTSAANQIFKSCDSEAIATEEIKKLDLMDEAVSLAKEASELKMKIHGAFLGIPENDPQSNNARTPAEYRAFYRKAAYEDAEKFVNSYGDKSIELKYYIQNSLEKGTINTKFNPNKATWGSGNTLICDVSGLKSTEALTQRLYEFSQTEEGADFQIQIKALYEKKK